MVWSLKLMLWCWFISYGSSRNPLNPCDEAKIINGLTICPSDEFYSCDKTVPWLDRNLVYVDCGRRALTEVPQTLPTNVELLSLDRNNICRIKVRDFIFYPNIILLKFRRQLCIWLQTLQWFLRWVWCAATSCSFESVGFE